MSYILSVDQSTTATKVYLWNESGKQIAGVSEPHRQLINSQNWIEHDLEEIYQKMLRAIRSVMMKANVDSKQIVALGISNQRETVACWDRATGKPLYNAVVWQCARATELVAKIEGTGVAAAVQACSGLPLSPYFSAAKLCWMVRNVAQVREALGSNRLMVGTIDSWLIYRLCGVHRTEYSNASRTQLLNLDTLQWDEGLLSLFDLKKSCMPEIGMSDSVFGMTDLAGILSRKIPIHGVLGDSHAALLFNRCFSKGEGKVTYGTGSSVMLNAGKSRPQMVNDLAVSVAWGRGGEVQYVLEGNINYAGSTLTWMSEELSLVHSVEEMESLALSVSSTGGVYLVPAFTGLAAPWFNNKVRAGIVGMNRTTRKAHVVRAALESIAYQVTDIVEAMRNALYAPIQRLYADGGSSKNSFLMQFQADMFMFPLLINQMRECSAAGAALCAAEAMGLCDPNQNFISEHKTFLPVLSTDVRDEWYGGWLDAVHTLLYSKGALR